MANGGDGTSTGGNVTLQPQCSPGVHQLAIIFETRQGYLTAPSAPVNWTTAGGRRASVTNIPTGPANVTARILAFTGANGASFFYVASNVPQSTAMRIADNTTTSLVVDFSDAALLAATNVDELFAQVALGECAGVIDYSSRLFWWGERSRVDNFVNLTFDGAFDPTGVTPLGWTRDATYGVGGAQESSNVVWGFAYRFTGPGTSQPTRRGMIAQSAYQDVDGVPILAPGTNYSVRLQAAKNSALGGATLTVDLYSASGGGQIALAQIANTALATAYQQFSLAFSAPTPATIPADLVLRVYADFEDVPGTSECIYVDDIEIFATNTPYNVSQVRASGVEDPESYDALTGVLSVAEENGQAVRAAFRLRESLYFVKEHSLLRDAGRRREHSRQVDHQRSVRERGHALGAWRGRGRRLGGDRGQGRALSFWRLGAGENLAGNSAHVGPDQLAIRPHAVGERGHAQQKNFVRRPARVGDAAEHDSDDGLSRAFERVADRGRDAGGLQLDHEETVLLRQRRGNGVRGALPRIAARCSSSAATAPRTCSSETRGNGKIYQFGDTQYSDDGAAIASYYTTAYFLPSEMEADLHLRSHRKLFGYFTAYAEGAGSLALSAFLNNAAFSQTLQPLALSSPAPKDLELSINVTSERVAFQLGTSAAGSWFRLRRLVPSLTQDPWAAVRGVN